MELVIHLVTHRPSTILHTISVWSCRPYAITRRVIFNRLSAKKQKRCLQNNQKVIYGVITRTTCVVVWCTGFIDLLRICKFIYFLCKSTFLFRLLLLKSIIFKDHFESFALSIFSIEKGSARATSISIQTRLVSFRLILSSQRPPRHNDLLWICI